MTQKQMAPGDLAAGIAILAKHADQFVHPTEPYRLESDSTGMRHVSWLIFTFHGSNATGVIGLDADEVADLEARGWYVTESGWAEFDDDDKFIRAGNYLLWHAVIEAFDIDTGEAT